MLIPKYQFQDANIKMPIPKMPIPKMLIPNLIDNPVSIINDGLKSAMSSPKHARLQFKSSATLRPNTSIDCSDGAASLIWPVIRSTVLLITKMKRTNLHSSHGELPIQRAT